MHLLALLVALASPNPGPPAADAGPSACGWSPAPTASPTAIAYPATRLGCGLAPAGPAAWQTITHVEVAALILEPKRTVLQVVFLDAQRRRVLPIGRPLRFDMRFGARHRGERTIPAEHRDGVFTVTLPRNRRAAPCESHLFLRVKGAKGVVEHWLDDWLYGC